MSLSLLTGPDAHDLLSAAAGSAGGRLLEWKVTQIDGTTVAYSARVAWGSGERTETLAAHLGPSLIDAPGTVTFSDGENQVQVWCVPFDPELPGLAAALDDGGTLVAYRPRRRAVVRRGSTWIKVVRPSAIRELHERHRMLHDAGVPVPRPLGWSDSGLLVLEHCPGTPLRSLLRSGGAMPSGEAVLELLARLPRAVSALPRRRSWSSLSPHYARMIGDALPSERDRALQLSDRITTMGDGEDPTHGDFYEAQLTVRAGAISGLLDVDTAGPGHRADDLACALAHLEFLALVSPAHAAGCDALLSSWRPVFERAVSPRDLDLRTAGVLLTLATGPHRVGRPDWAPRTREALDLVEARLCLRNGRDPGL